MSSMYSQPQNDGMQGFEHMPLRDRNQPQEKELEWPNHQKAKKRARKYKWSTYIFGGLFAVCLLLSVVFIRLYITEKTKSPEMPKNGTVFTSVVTTTTSIPGKASTITQTLPPVTQTTVQTETEVSRITTETTKTLALTTTDTKAITVTPTKDPHDGKRCMGNQQYGGQELHDINSDYDLLLADGVQGAVDAGMDIGGAQVLAVALRSVFLCLGSHSIQLVQACESGFERNPNDESKKEKGCERTVVTREPVEQL